MPAIQPTSSAPVSSLVWEIDANAATAFGDSPINVTVPTPVSATIGDKLGRILDYLRSRTMPAVLASLGAQVTIIHRSQTVDPSDPLNVTTVEATTALYAAVMGPSLENIQKGLLQISDLECVIAANDLATPLSGNEAIQVGSVKYDIVGIQGYPRVPDPVAYRYMLRRAA